MAGLNQCNFIGNLGSEITLRYTQGGQAVGNVNMAVTEKYKDQEKTEWVKLVFWGKSAEIVEKYAGKGSSLFVSGRMQTRSWEKDSQTHYTTEIVVSNFQFLGGGQHGQGNQNQSQNRSQGGYQQQSRPQSQPRPPREDRGYDPNDDIPF